MRGSRHLPIHPSPPAMRRAVKGIFIMSPFPRTSPLCGSYGATISRRLRSSTRVSHGYPTLPTAWTSPILYNICICNRLHSRLQKITHIFGSSLPIVPTFALAIGKRPEKNSEEKIFLKNIRKKFGWYYKKVLSLHHFRLSNEAKTKKRSLEH